MSGSHAPRPELVALLDAIKDNPDEDTPRLVLADWLDEQGNELDAERAAFIRADIAAELERERAAPPTSRRALGSLRKPAATDRYAKPDDRLRRWLGPAADLAALGGFDRGLPGIVVHGKRFEKPDVVKLLTTEWFAFVQSVNLFEAGKKRIVEMAARPEFRFVPGFYAAPMYAFGVEFSEKFFACPNLTGLRHIVFRGINPGADGTAALAANPALGRLRKLSLYHNKLVDKAAAALAGSKNFAHLTYLNLSDNNIGDKGAEALAASSAFPRLLELDLTLNPRLTDAGKAVLRARFGDRVKL
jgi:uncharacterized protein (TIGR02996 family)